MIKCDEAEVTLTGSIADLKAEWMLICRIVFTHLYENNKEQVLDAVNTAMMSKDELHKEVVKRLFEEKNRQNRSEHENN